MRPDDSINSIYTSQFTHTHTIHLIRTFHHHPIWKYWDALGPLTRKSCRSNERKPESLIRRAVFGLFISFDIAGTAFQHLASCQTWEHCAHTVLSLAFTHIHSISFDFSWIRRVGWVNINSKPSLLNWFIPFIKIQMQTFTLMRKTRGFEIRNYWLIRITPMWCGPWNFICRFEYQFI